MSGGVLPDLRLLDKTKHEAWHDVVLEGVLANRSMPGFKHLMNRDDSEAIRQYVLKRARDTRPQPKADKMEKKKK